MVCFIFSILALIVGVILIICRVKGVAESSGGEAGFLISGIACVVLAVILILVAPIRIVDPGQVGIKVYFGKVQPGTLGMGFHYINLFTDVKIMSIRTEEYTMSIATGEGKKVGNDSISVLTKDGLMVDLDTTIFFHLDPEMAETVYEKLGLDYIEKFVRPQIRTALREIPPKYPFAELYADKREEAAQGITDKLKASLAPRGIIVEQTLLRNIAPPEKIKIAIEEKLAEKESAAKMEFTLQKEALEADRKRVEAQGIADANDIISNSLTERYIQWYYVQTMGKVVESPNNSTYIMPYDQQMVPMMNMK